MGFPSRASPAHPPFLPQPLWLGPRFTVLSATHWPCPPPCPQFRPQSRTGHPRRLRLRLRPRLPSAASGPAPSCGEGHRLSPARPPLLWVPPEGEQPPGGRAPCQWAAVPTHRRGHEGTGPTHRPPRKQTPRGRAGPFPEEAWWAVGGSERGESGAGQAGPGPPTPAPSTFGCLRNPSACFLSGRGARRVPPEQAC